MYILFVLLCSCPGHRTYFILHYMRILTYLFDKLKQYGSWCFKIFLLSYINIFLYTHTHFFKQQLYFYCLWILWILFDIIISIPFLLKWQMPMQVPVCVSPSWISIHREPSRIWISAPTPELPSPMLAGSTKYGRRMMKNSSVWVIINLFVFHLC